MRRPFDEPWRGFVVRFHLTVRRFCCDEPRCPRSTFAESFGALLGRHQHRTAGCQALLTAVAQAVGGEAGTRLARQFGVPVSADTLLRLLHRLPELTTTSVRVLGVDDFALKRRHTYGTLLVDLETHRPIDLLEGREATVLSQWLQAHPGVEIVVRDRAEAYAEGARVGAPQAQQIADRFHLLKNATEALNEVLKGHRRQVEIGEQASVVERLAEGEVSPAPAPEPPLSQTKRQEAARRERRVARWAEVRRLHAEGISQRQIARELGIDRETVKRLLETPEPPRNQRVAPPRPRGLSSPTLQPFMAYLQDRWQQGCHSVTQLYRELVAQGYAASRSLLYDALKAWQPPRPPRASSSGPPPRRYRVRTLCLRPQEHLDEAERQALAVLLAREPELATGHALVERFRALVAKRKVADLPTWLADARASALPAFVSLANGLEADRAAVEAALSSTWSNGPVEGMVHKLKLIKRQGYGRASFALLRRRVLVA
jgi:transposase